MIAPNDKLTKPIELHPSTLAMQFTTLGHCLGGVAVFSNRLNLLLQLLLLIALSIHYVYNIYTWRHQPRLRLYCHYNVWFISVDQSKLPLYTILRCSYWHPWLVILEVKNQRSNKNSYLPILIDRCRRHEFKRLQLIAVSKINNNQAT